MYFLFRPLNGDRRRGDQIGDKESLNVTVNIIIPTGN